MKADAHGRSSETHISWTSPDVATPTHAERARTLVASQSLGTLATIAQEPAGYPYASMVTFALDQGEPIFLISRIAEHTRNLSADARASLLVHETGNSDPLANGRVTLVGRTSVLARSSHASSAHANSARASSARDAFLAAHPTSAYYVDYDDFDFWKLRLEAVRYIGGYGRMSWVSASDFRGAEVDPVSGSAARILEHMNADHRAALRLYARAFTQASDIEEASMTAIDRLGFELSVKTTTQVGPARIAFDSPLTSADEARPVLIALLRAAEAKLGAQKA